MTVDRLDLGDAFDGVLDLVEVVAVPRRHAELALEEERPGPRGTVAAHVDQLAGRIASRIAGADSGRWQQISGRMCGDGHGPNRNRDPMSAPEHHDVVRQSFRRQVGLFTGPDSQFARRDGATDWLEPLIGHELVLEVACGAAHLSEAVAPRVHQVVALDLTPELLALAAERLGSSGIGNVLLQEGDAGSLPFVGGSFDLAFCRASLHHLLDPGRALAEMVRVCRPGGRVAISDLIVPPEVDRERFDAIHRLLDPSHVRALLGEELAALAPAGVAVTAQDPTISRFPFDIAVTAQSDREGVVAALRDDLGGGAPTGFDPEEVDGALTVAFRTRTVLVTVT